ncbi:MAG TPA: zf-HC2 domain-containing protein [Gemmatimonadales bacterium]|jgi:anti-sigma factor (TIGR02949 family)
MSAPMLSCAETIKRLDDYLDRELMADDLAAVELHLSRCAMCSEEFKVEKELLDAVRAKLARIRLPAGFRERLAVRLLQE